MTTQDEMMVRSAATRAAVMGWLNRNPGAHVVKEIAQGMGEESQRVRNALRSLAESGQVLAEGEGHGRGHLVRWSSPAQPPEGPQLALPAVAKAHPPAKKKKKSRPSENPMIGVGERIRDIVCADPMLSEEDVYKRLLSDGFDCRATTLTMVYRDTQGVIERMKPRAHRKSPEAVRLVPERQRAPGELEIVVSGVTVVVGRNPETGRIRIGILEDES